MNQQLIKEIEQTIAAYQEACKPENLNVTYCYQNDIFNGICYFSDKKKFTFLSSFLQIILLGKYIKITPISIDWHPCNNPSDYPSLFLEAHQFRINYLQKLLTILKNGTN